MSDERSGSSVDRADGVSGAHQVGGSIPSPINPYQYNFFWQPGVSLKDIERAVIITAYKHYGYNKTWTAMALGMSIRCLRMKLNQYRRMGQYYG